ncbi:MAG: hypothetical protein IIZ46_08395 [Clostridia bacterium]|nr:hypothetical protein [Clostridia bacterium]
MALISAFMWLGIAIFLFIFGIKDNKIYMVFSVYFVFNGVWWFISSQNDSDMFHGSLGLIYRGVTAVFLVIGCLYYYFYKTRNNEKKE